MSSSHPDDDLLVADGALDHEDESFKLPTVGLMERFHEGLTGLKCQNLVVQVDSR